jgi:hypothetical protein
MTAATRPMLDLLGSDMVGSESARAVVAGLTLLEDGRWHTWTNLRRAMRAGGNIQPKTAQNLLRELRNFGAVVSKRGQGGPIVLKMTTLGAAWWKEQAR